MQPDPLSLEIKWPYVTRASFVKLFVASSRRLRFMKLT